MATPVRHFRTPPRATASHGECDGDKEIPVETSFLEMV